MSEKTGRWKKVGFVKMLMRILSRGLTWTDDGGCCRENERREGRKEKGSVRHKRSISAMNLLTESLARHGRLTQAAPCLPFSYPRAFALTLVPVWSPLIPNMYPTWHTAPPCIMPALRRYSVLNL